MGFISYKAMMKTTDVRVVKTKKVLFDALVDLMGKKPVHRITVTELCERSIINRSTFYLHFKDVKALCTQWLEEMVTEYLNRLVKAKIIGNGEFDAERFIRFTHELVMKYPAEFRCLYEMRADDQMYHILGRRAVELANKLMEEKNAKIGNTYPYAMIFTISGLIISYIDWWEMGRTISLDYLAKTSNTLCTIPLGEILKEV